MSRLLAPKTCTSLPSLPPVLFLPLTSHHPISMDDLSYLDENNMMLPHQHGAVSEDMTPCSDTDMFRSHPAPCSPLSAYQDHPFHQAWSDDSSNNNRRGVLLSSDQAILDNLWNANQPMQMSQPTNPKMNSPPSQALHPTPTNNPAQTLKWRPYKGSKKESAAGLKQNPARKAAKKKSSRDSQRLPSLAATHPAQYQTPVSKPMLNHKTLPKVVKLPSTNALQTPPLSPPSSRPALSPLRSVKKDDPEVPWRTFMDPKRESTSNPVWWERENGLRNLKADTNLSVGNVTSPVRLIGLPLGCGMIETAHAYEDDAEMDEED